jgi:hypothetical protein
MATCDHFIRCNHCGELLPWIQNRSALSWMATAMRVVEKCDRAGHGVEAEAACAECIAVALSSAQASWTRAHAPGRENTG